MKNTGLKLNIQKTKIMASSTITSLQVDGETMESVIDFIFLDSKITADGDCSHEIKSRLILRRKKRFLYSSVGKESTSSAGDLSLIPGSGRSVGELIGYPLKYCWAFLVAQLVKNLPAMWET